MFDLKNDLKLVPSILPQAVSGNVNGSEVDLKGFGGALLIANGDGTADGNVKIQETDTSGSGYTDAAAGDVIGTQDSDVDATDGEITLGYIGDKRYIRAVWTDVGGSGDVCVAFLLGKPDLAPVSGNDN